MAALARVVGAATAAAVFVWMSSASAVTIYDEGSSGDLDAIGTTLVNLQLGTNDILGSINATPPAETDRIRFAQVPGLIVDSIVLSFTAPFDDFSIGQNLDSALFNSVANLFDDNFGAINSGASISASFFDSFGPETGPLSQDTPGAIWDFQLSAGTVFPAQPWKLTITTSQAPTSVVPLPAAFPLFASGIGGLGLFGWRRKRKAAAVSAA
jgi:hypothetical protein